jgi:hydroxymethylglutaryl-CoA lyase
MEFNLICRTDNLKKDEKVTIVEISPRDGLPDVCKGLSTADKVMFINKLSQTGFKKIECASFLHPRLLPLYSDAERVVGGIKKQSGVTYVGLVPNEIGCRRALITQIDEILMLVAASDVFNRVTIGRTLRETMNKTLPTIFEATGKSGKSIRIYILTAFGCPYTGVIPPDEVRELVLKLSYLGATEITLVDSTGMANPRKVKSLIKSILDLNLDIKLAVHFHNTRGAAIANCVAAYEAGIRIFDTSLGGMSGTPYGSMELDLGYWNVPTEDLVNLFEEMGIKTGIDFDRLLECVKIAEKFVGEQLPGHLLRANPNWVLAQAPDYLITPKHLDI